MKMYAVMESATVVIPNYEPEDDLKLRDRETKAVVFMQSEFKEVPAELLNHPELQRVAFSRCTFTHVTSLDQLKYCRNLTELTLRWCGLETFPDFMSSLQILKSLNVSGNSFVGGLPNSIGKLRNLEALDISFCILEDFAAELSELKTLKTLNIEQNGIQDISESIANLTMFEKLNVSRCELREFPGGLCELKSLQELQIEGNKKVERLPESLRNLTNLHKLNISETSITRLPQAIEGCKNLKEINICYCQFREFPTVIYQLKNMSTVSATGVRFEVLDEDFVKLWSQKPHIFTTKQFQILSFPDEKMVETRRIEVERGVGKRRKKVQQTVVRTIPARNISTRYMFVKPQDEIVQRGPYAYIRYYRALNADNAVNCYLLNVTVMGKTGAGKSSLIHSIKEGSSVLVDPSDRTVMVDTLEVKHEDVLLKIADFGGHDIYEMTCPLFLKSKKQLLL